MTHPTSDNTLRSGGKELPIGTRIEEFIIERVLGSGGFGITYLARDTSLNRQVVIKENLPSQFAHRDTTSLTVHPGPGREDQDNFRWSLENFSREAETLASLRHPGIVPVLRRFDAFGTAYFVMPFVEGITLDELLKERQEQGKAFPETEVGGLMERLLDALAHLHDHGIYHRDIKPGNILITNEGIPVLIDFGSARQRLSERSLTVIESPGYTPFEQLQSRGNVGPWSDLYALGGTLCKAITGEVPPKATDRAFDDPWVPLAERVPLCAIYSVRFLANIDCALAMRIEIRWKDAGDWLAASRGNAHVAEDLTNTGSGEETRTVGRLGSRVVRSGSRKRQFVGVWLILGLIAIAVVGGVILRGKGKKQTEEAKSPSVVSISRTDDNTTREHTIEQLQKEEDTNKPAIREDEARKQPPTPGGTAGGVLLTTELPKEVIEGTPKPPKGIPKLIPAPTAAPTFFVPEGTVLLSKGKKVTSSDENPIIGSLDLITDGEKQSIEGYFVELMDGIQWVQIDLEISSPIHAVWVWHFHSQKRAYHDVVIQISDDPEFKTTVTTIYNNDYDNSSRLGKCTDNPYVESRFGMIADGKGTKGRYVRLYSNGNTSNEYNHYTEVEVYGNSLQREREQQVSATDRATPEQSRHEERQQEPIELEKEKARPIPKVFAGLFEQDIPVKGQIGMVAPPREISKYEAKVETAARKDPKWFKEYSDKAKPGVPLPYNERLGLTKKEYDQYLVLWNKREFKPSEEVMLQLRKGAGGTWSLTATGEASSLSILRYNPKDDVFYSHNNKLKRIDDIKTDASSIFGEWTGFEWKFEEKTGQGNTKENFAIGRYANNKYGLVVYRSQEFSTEGTCLLNKNLVIRFQLDRPGQGKDVTPHYKATQNN